MFYNDFKGEKLSALGLGCMRLPKLDGKDSQIDIKATEEMIDFAIKSGINYFDTAYGYHSGNSETVVGEILSKYDRKSFYLATKFPGYDLNNMASVEKIFNEQLKKCKVDYFDFYLFHNVCEKNIDAYLDEKYGIYDYLTEQKRNGRIKHLGFSCHGDMGVLKRFLDAYGKDMEFCQLQINYIDWKLQNAKEKVELLDKMNIPVFVMEPIRGGKLASLGETAESKLQNVRANETPVALAFRFIQSLPTVKMTLSGMSNMEQLKDNIRIYSENLPLNDSETAALLGVADEIISGKTVPCTACRYCTDYCPNNLDIPKLLSLYNEHSVSEGGFIAPMVLSTIERDKWPDACIGCRSCENVCPQRIKISEALSKFSEKLGNK